MLVAQRAQLPQTAASHSSLSHIACSRLPRRHISCRGTHRFSLQAHYDVYVKADPTDATKLGDCPFSHRVLLALEEKKADYERHLIDLKHKPDWFLSMTEKGSTPVLKINEEDKILTDSADIIGYLDEKIAEPHLGSPSEVPESVTELLPTFVKYIGAKGPDSFKYMTALRGVLEELNGHFKSSGPFLNGREITAGDCVLAPLLYQVEIVCYNLKDVDLFAHMKGIAKYNANIRSRDSWKHSQYSQEAVIAGWKPKVA